MPTPVGSPKKNQVAVTLAKVDGQYQAVGTNVGRIGEKRNKPIVWVVNNPTIDKVTVKIHKFEPASPCPVEGHDFTGCSAVAELRSGETARFRAKINKDGSPGKYSYEIFVSNSATGVGNAIDPELQIDGDFHAFFKSPVVIVTAIIVLAALAYWFIVR